MMDAPTSDAYGLSSISPVGMCLNCLSWAWAAAAPDPAALAFPAPDTRLEDCVSSTWSPELSVNFFVALDRAPETAPRILRFMPP